MNIELEKSENYLEKITEIYAFVSVDAGGEGIIGQSMNLHGQNIFMPFVCADKDRMESLKPIAVKLALDQGIKIKLIRLSVRKELEEY
jgi:hypothetical protein